MQEQNHGNPENGAPKLTASFNAMNIRNVNAYWREKHIADDFRMNARAERVLKAVDMAFASTMQNYLKKDEPAQKSDSGATPQRKSPIGFD